jgi:uroporphyrinogen decarboxylase
MLVDKFEPDGVFPFMDLTVELEACGVEINFPENDNPSLAKHPIKDKESIDALRAKTSKLRGRIPVFIAVMSRLARNYSKLIKSGYVIGPFTMAGELMGVSETIMNAVLEPTLVNELVTVCTKFITLYAKDYFDAGADVITVLEPMAALLSPELYETFSLLPFQQILNDVDKGPMFLHICGNTMHLIDGMSRSGAAGLSLDSIISLSEARKKLPDEITLIGNIDPVQVFLQSSPDQVMAVTHALKHEMINDRNFILSSGCDLPPATPLENIAAFMQAARDF